MVDRLRLGTPPSHSPQDSVDLHLHLLDLFYPLTIGEEVLPGVTFEDASTDLGLRLRFRVGGERIWVDVGPIERVRRYAARSGLLGFGYRTEGGRSRLDPGTGLRLCAELARLASAREEGVVARLRELARAEADPSERVRRVEVTRALEPAGAAGAQYYTLNPYVGCVIGCRFCYAQTPIAAMRWLLGLEEYAWGSYVEVRSNLAEVLAEEMRTLPPLPFKMCPIVADAYQPAEKRERVTRRCLEAVADGPPGWVASVLTRSSLILRDIDVLSRIEEVWAGVSLPTIDDTVRRHFEPRASSVDERIEVLLALRAAGVNTLAVVQPMMAGSVLELADALARSADAVVIDVLQEEEGAVDDFSEPAYRETRDEAWQRDRALELHALLLDRGVDVWKQDLPPKYCTAV